ncbi:SapC family protein [Stenotrophomonas sp. 24(2023)]|uniref:SapC family protein n=1 Tax=Stenotrophomonas sp. 24(2023) TaxID=3068324 RepID=UPI0027E1B127|nr:SapC family protein [Stenotrophomonas sp. 24(2023)]WMJ69172.1 SapC family protein [Stenotrophomonas sp. 24(2023)]
MTTASDTPTTAAPTSAPLFYNRPVPLQADVHADVRILPGRLGFAAATNSIPLVAGEFALALHHYPILFAGDDAVPMAAVGVTEDNLFVSEGEWDANSYIPAYVRRHPFIFIDTGDENQFLLGLDEESDRVVKGGSEGQPLFVDGKAEEIVQNALDFCGQFTREHEQTRAFSQALKAQDLLVVRNATVRTHDGREFNLNGFQVIDAEKLQALPEAIVVDWHRKGWLSLANQHLMSLGRFSDLTNRMAARAA